METFDFPFHTVEDEYPVSSTTIKFGGGYQYATKPIGPDQIRFILNYEAMWFYELTTGVLDVDRNPLRNMQRMVLFYEQHRLYEPFIYVHPRRGPVTVRFDKPLRVPEGVKAGRGQTKPFKIELILQP